MDFQDPIIQSIVAAIKQHQGLPVPTGTNDNGEPYWVVGERTIKWAEMQQIFWQVQQAEQARQQASGGPEKMPQMPNAVKIEAPSQPETQIEQISSPESAAEKGQEQKAEKAETPAAPSTPVVTKPTPPQPEKKSNTASVFGQSPKLQHVDPTEPQSMLNFVEAHSKGSSKKSNTFLASLLKKILLVMSS